MDGIGEAILRYFNFNFWFFWKYIRTRFVTRRESISVLVVFLEFEVVEKKGIILSIDRAMLAMTYFFFFFSLEDQVSPTDFTGPWFCHLNSSTATNSLFSPSFYFSPVPLYSFRVSYFHLSLPFLSFTLFLSVAFFLFYSIFRFLCPNILSSCIFNLSLSLSLSFNFVFLLFHSSFHFFSFRRRWHFSFLFPFISFSEHSLHEKKRDETSIRFIFSSCIFNFSFFLSLFFLLLIYFVGFSLFYFILCFFVSFLFVDVDIFLSYFLLFFTYISSPVFYFFCSEHSFHLFLLHL